MKHNTISILDLEALDRCAKREIDELVKYRIWLQKRILQARKTTNKPKALPAPETVKCA